uniref:DNA polymerase epsilon subunit 3 n=1 Tax=Clastoptera arizonana TaxID=38151 RepID=A0A1B6CV29_9HEMI
MAEKLEDLNLPNAVIARLIKDCLPEHTNIAKEARIVIAKAASVFVLYITSAANNVALKNNKKTISGQDVLQAIIDTEFTFIKPLEQFLEEFKKSQKLKKETAARKKLEKKTDQSVEEEDGGEEEEEVEDN